MDPTIVLDERVDVAVIFKKNGEAHLNCVPSKMRYGSRDIIFTQLAFRHPTAKGRRMIHVFDVSDGANDYRLEFDAEALTWKLTAILEGEGETNREYG